MQGCGPSDFYFSNKGLTVSKHTPSIRRDRRRILLGSAVGASALAVWQKPVLNSVVLPAHAQTSNAGVFALSAPGDAIFPNPSINLNDLISEVYSNSRAELLTKQTKSILDKAIEGTLDLLVPSAQAQSSSEVIVSFYLAPQGTDTYSLQMLVSGPIPDTECVVDILFTTNNLVVGDAVGQYASLSACFTEEVEPETDMFALLALTDSTATIRVFDDVTVELGVDPNAAPLFLGACPCFEEVPFTLQG